MSRPPARPPRLAELFGVDLRSLAVVRIGARILLLVDLALRSRDFRAHYTDFGIEPGAPPIFEKPAVVPVQERTTARGLERDGILTLLVQRCDPVPPSAPRPEEGVGRE